MTRQVALGAIVGFTIMVLLTAAWPGATPPPPPAPAEVLSVLQPIDANPTPRAILPRPMKKPVAERAYVNDKRQQLPNRALMRWALVAAGLLAACVPPRPAEPVAAVAADPALEVVRRFVGAVRAQRFDEALALTSSRWRAALTPEQFKADFEAEPLAPQRLERLEQALSVPVTYDGARARLGAGAEQVLALVREDDGWRVDALTR